jgi:hypothetical protein
MGFLTRLDSSIKNQKSKIARLPRRSRDGISHSPRLFNQKSKIKNQKSKIKNQKSKID